MWIERACFAALHPARGHEAEDVELKLLVWPLHGTIEDDGLAHRIAFGRDDAVGGLFYFNYPGGSGLCAGAVFGKIAGTSAGRARAN